jgi:hypothetical protein
MRGQSHFFAFVFLRQSLRTDPQSGWSEAGLSFYAYLSDLERQPILLEGQELRCFLRNLTSSTPRIKAPSVENVSIQLTTNEQELVQALRRPSEEEVSKGVRHAVWPIACGIVDVEK